MKKQIIVINGTGGCGKDTFVDFCKKYSSIMNFSSIDKVKEIATLIGWNGTKTDKDRKFLADLKRLTTEYNDMAFNSIKEAINEFRNSRDELLFIHIREPEEIDRMVREFGAKTLLIKRDGLELIKSNPSDANVENYNYDFIVVNKTLDDLDKQAYKFIDEIKKDNNIIIKWDKLKKI